VSCTQYKTMPIEYSHSSSGSRSRKTAGTRIRAPVVTSAYNAIAAFRVGRTARLCQAGPEVSQPGERVWVGPGSYAEQVVLPADRVVPVPDGVSDELAAAAIWISSGELDVRIGGRYPLAEAARAQRDLAARRPAGKLLLLP
jgi:D-arabinose 1-dehydrogenase-like Zn-dependent alcohol dehydrogenase